MSRWHSAALFETDRNPYCQTGIEEGLLGASLAEILGGGTFGGLAAGALEGGALGAITSGISGGDPLKGAFGGALTGGAVGGFGPAIGESLGIGAIGGDALTGAVAGAAGSAITGGSPFSGALTGGAGGAIAGVLGTGGTSPGGSASVSTTPTTGAGGGTSALSTTGVSPSGGLSVDPTSDLGAWGVASSGQTAFGGGSSGAPGWAGGGPGGITATGGSQSAFQAGDGGSGGIGSKIMGLVEKNPGVLLGGALLGANMLMGDKALPGEAALQQAAGEAGTMGRTMAAYQQSGTLPPGLQSVVDSQIDAAKAALVSQYGDLGLGHSTMLTDKLNALKAQKSAEIATFADNLAKQGTQWASLSGQEFTTLLNAQAGQDEAFSKSLGLFAAGLAGMRPTT